MTLPKLVKETEPVYPEEAKRERIQGTVELEGVVPTDGTVGDIRISRALHPMLDAEAIKTLREWRFEPGTKGGQAVPVQVTIEMTFSLR